MNILLRLAYEGTNYHGFQVQSNALSVCAVIQDAMEAVLGHRPDVKGCSRTDAGVHARDFALNFRSDTAIPLEKLPLALNSRLPADVRVKSARRVPEGFHARYACAGKQYEYVILNSQIEDVFARGLYYRVPGPLDAAAMDAAGKALIGRHDFAAFQSAGSGVADTVRTVTELSVAREGDWVRMRIAADGFLYNMVRIIGGTLLAAGCGQLDPAAIAGILAQKDRRAAGDTLPAKGLFLNRVNYPPEALDPDLGLDAVPLLDPKYP